MKKELGVDAAIELGSTGQFDVVVEGQTVASKKQGLLARRPGDWPEEDQVIEALRARR